MLTQEEKDILTAKFIEYLDNGKDLSDIILNTPEGQKLYAEICAELESTYNIQNLVEVRPMEENK